MMLGGALLLQLLLILVFRSPLAGASGATEARNLLPALEDTTAVRLQLGGSGEEPITLERKDEGWSVVELDGFPADGEKVDRLLDDLEALNVRRPVVSSARYHETFKVGDDENEGRIRVWAGSEEEPAVDLIVGDSPNYRLTHVRLADSDEVFEARGLSSYDVRSATGNWIRKELCDAAQDQVVGIVLTNPTGTFELQKLDGVWRVVAPESSVDLELDSTKVDNLVRSATSLRLADAVGARDDAAHGFASPAATVVVRWNPAGEIAAGESPTALQELTIEIGSQIADDDSKRYVGRSGFEFTGSTWDSSVTSLIEKTLDDLSAS
jgi:hypothetical protein